MRVKLADCNCYPNLGLLVVADSKKFEAEMNLPCPAHGFRCLGQLMIIRVKAMNGDSLDDAVRDDAVRTDELLAEYRRRLAEFLKSNPELRDDHEAL
jgi:hypothetical protein